MQYDRSLTVSIASTRKASNWISQNMTWSSFIKKLAEPVVTAETYEQFMSLKKAQQDELKDVGGFVAGRLKDGRRKAENVQSRCMITLDADNIEPGGTNRILQILSGLGCAYCVYSTRKHHPAKPRLRIILPLDRDVSADEYEAIARKLASLISLDIMDPSTFEASRLMYWPSHSKDSVYVFIYEDKPFISADGMLQMYQDWRNTEEWPRISGEKLAVEKQIKKQEDPLGKENIVRSFL